MKERVKINRTLRTEIKTDRRRQKNKQSKARLDQLDEIPNHATSRRCDALNSGRGRFHRRSFHVARASFAFIVDVSFRCACKIRQTIAQMLTPKDSMAAPIATCAVATSAALLLQIVQAPSVT